MCCMLQHPHAGQIWISKFQMVFRSSIMGQTGISSFEALMTPEFKYPFQISGFISVIQKTIIPDFLEAGWQYMHQVFPDEFCMS